MGTKAFSFNSQAKYQSGGHSREKANILSLANQEIMVDDKGSHFKAVPAKLRPLVRLCRFCVSFEDHLQAEKPLLASLYRFHVYYTTRRLLEELRVALPGDKSHSWYENPYNSRAYKRLCFEFGVSPDRDRRQKLYHGCQGLGSWRTFMIPSGAYRHANVAQGPFFHPKDSMRHNRNISGAWTTFVLDRSEGFTQAGVERLNDLIRTYVWAILREQAQTRLNVLKTGKGFDPRNNFWQISKTRLPRPLTSPAASLAITKHSSMHPHPWTSCLGLNSICRRATWHSIRAIPRGSTTRSK